MDNKELDQIIKDYLTTENTDYAIMISGEWGSGKSYYINHGFSALSNSIKVPEEEESFYSPAYISLYGVSSVEDFEVRVFNGVNDWVNNGFIRVAGLLGKKTGEFFGISSGKEDVKALTYISKKRVLVFDDLERICDDKIPVKEVLGLINSYAEHSHLKVIIVCNEVWYSSDDTSEDVRKDYKKYKEKSVRFTYKFEPDIDHVFDVMATTITDDDYREYLCKDKKAILSLFRLGGEKNLRTLKFFIDTFGKIYHETQLANNKDKVTRTYLVTFMLYACEYKLGHQADELETLDVRRYKIDTSYFGGKNKYKKEQVNETKDYQTAFVDKYKAVYSEFRLCRLLIDYIETGYFDESRFKNEIGILDEELNRMAVTPEGLVYQKLVNMTDLNDNEVMPLIAEMMSYVGADKYNLYDLLNIYALLLKYAYWHIGGFELTEGLDDAFKASMERQRDVHQYYNLFEVKTPMFDHSAQNTQEYKKYKALKDLGMSINWQAKFKDDTTKGEKFLVVAKSGDVKRLRDYRINTNNHISITGMDWKGIVELINTAPNPIACEVCECLISFTETPVGPDDRDRINEELIPALNEFLERGEPLIRRMYVTELKKHMEEVIR